MTTRVVAVLCRACIKKHPCCGSEAPASTRRQPNAARDSHMKEWKDELNRLSSERKRKDKSGQVPGTPLLWKRKRFGVGWRRQIPRSQQSIASLTRAIKFNSTACKSWPNMNKHRRKTSNRHEFRRTDRSRPALSRLGVRGEYQQCIWGRGREGDGTIATDVYRFEQVSIENAGVWKREDTSEPFRSPRLNSKKYDAKTSGGTRKKATIRLWPPPESSNLTLPRNPSSRRCDANAYRQGITTYNVFPHRN
ncbi:hypothetical protein EVAR_59526_1 [Eumeta japonica]|uniref:Uncharacterized protein n=1 Tax=Eumeta variegata TaxID=151549 RepID=A0A4C1XX35_EUMVA|nr:hypothetical protein EVAR_59526_1 [Eumeta japonica]